MLSICFQNESTQAPIFCINRTIKYNVYQTMSQKYLKGMKLGDLRNSDEYHVLLKLENFNKIYVNFGS